MSEKLPPSFEEKLPSPTESAETISKWVPAIAFAFTAYWYPEAAFVGVMFEFVRERFVEWPKKLLLEELRKGNVQNLSAKRLAQFIPMAYKFFEAAKEGEYERNLRILAAFLRGELEQEEPDASNFARMVRRIEGLSPTDLRVIAMVDASLSKTTMTILDEGTTGERSITSATVPQTPQKTSTLWTKMQIEELLVDLAARGFFITDGSTRAGKNEEYYFVSSSFRDLMDRAREQVVSEENGAETPGQQA